MIFHRLLFGNKKDAYGWSHYGGNGEVFNAGGAASPPRFYCQAAAKR
jgi:hypothetical protein